MQIETSKMIYWLYLGCAWPYITHLKWIFQTSCYCWLSFIRLISQNFDLTNINIMCKWYTQMQRSYEGSCCCCIPTGFFYLLTIASLRSHTFVEALCVSMERSITITRTYFLRSIVYVLSIPYGHIRISLWTSPVFFRLHSHRAV